MYLDGRVFKDAADLVDTEFSELIAAYRGAEPEAAKAQRRGFLVLQILRKMIFLAWKGEEPDTGAFDLKLEDALSR